MLNIITATRFSKKMGNGRTLPCLIECEDEDGNLIEVIVKCSRGCMEREKNLAFEAIAAMLAADLELPVPEPYIVELTPEFIELISDKQIKENYIESCEYAFGSRYIKPGFAVWSNGQKIPKELTQEAAEIFTYDAIIVNSDRRPTNPNCLYSGSEIAIFDHELAFAMSQILFWKAPWIEDGFDEISKANNHIFSYSYFEERPTEMNRFIAAWHALAENRFEEYRNALPIEWKKDGNAINKIIDHLSEARTNIEIIVTNASKVLT